ncbi:MAG: MaoC family dehydratase [Maritimibacter sp.]
MNNVIRGTIPIEDIEIGMSRELVKTITDRDILQFSEVSTDRNPVHMDEDYAKNTMFKGRIAHGMLSAALISAVIGEQLPGHGTIYLGQHVKFLAPVRPGDPVRAVVTVTDLDRSKRRVVLKTECFVEGKRVVSGEATVLAPGREE